MEGGGPERVRNGTRSHSKSGVKLRPQNRSPASLPGVVLESQAASSDSLFPSADRKDGWMDRRMDRWMDVGGGSRDSGTDGL